MTLNTVRRRAGTLATDHHIGTSPPTVTPPQPRGSTFARPNKSTRAPTPSPHRHLRSSSSSSSPHASAPSHRIRHRRLPRHLCLVPGATALAAQRTATMVSPTPCRVAIQSPDALSASHTDTMYDIGVRTQPSPSQRGPKHQRRPPQKIFQALLSNPRNYPLHLGPSRHGRPHRPRRLGAAPPSDQVPP